MSPNEKSLHLLRKAAAQFRFYEQSHLAKRERYRAILDDPTENRSYLENHISPAFQDTCEKARVNAELAAELEAHIAFLEDDAA